MSSTGERGETNENNKIKATLITKKNGENLKLNSQPKALK
jgi:hypothetical protein